MTVHQLRELRRTQPTARVTALRDAYLRLKPRIGIDRARILTRSMKATEGEPMVIRRAKAFAAIVRGMPIHIAPDELFVGYVGATRECQPATVELGPYLEMFLAYPGERKFFISEEDERELQTEILPYWRADGLYERTPCGRLQHQISNLFYADPMYFPAGGSLIGSNGTYYQDVGHQVIDYVKVLQLGYRGVQEEAARRLAQLDPADPDHLRMIPFVRAVVIAMEAAAEIGTRFADKARKLARTEASAARARELLALAEVCDHVPAHPARTFYEALQSYWFTYILQYWESMEGKCHSMGRMDQYLYPY